MERASPIEPEELLAHAHWMRSLAQSLVHDASSADDVVQESMAAALRRPPLGGPTMNAWLARVVRHVASNFKRGEQRLAERHRARGADEGSLDPSATIERLDTQRLIVDLVRELDEPARSTIVMTYFEGLTSVEVGRRMGVSDATVRWRTQKALDELRARLQRKCGSRDAWCALLVPFTHTFKIGAGTAAAAGATAGAMTMGAMSKVALAAVSLSIVGAGLWFVMDREEPGARSAEAAAPALNEHEKLIEPVAPAVVEREVLAPPAQPAPASASSASTAKVAELSVPGSNALVRARFVDSSGQPWTRVAFRVAEERGWPVADEEKWPSTSSEADGRAELMLTLPEEYRDPNFQFIATRSGCATRTMRVSLVLGGAVDLGDVVIEREARVLGKVHDAQGNGLSDVTVGLLQGDAMPSDLANQRRNGPYEFDRMIIVTHSDARGAFELRAFPAGKWQLWGHREGLGYGASDFFELKADEVKEGIDFEVPALLPTDTISGIVLAPDGAPVSQARVTYLWKSGRGSSGSVSAVSNGSGRFEIVLNTDAPGALSAEQEGKRWASSTTHGIAPGARDLVIQLADLGAQQLARLRVRGPANEPVAGVKLMLYERTSGTGFTGHPQAAREIEVGNYEFEVPRVPFKLIVSADGYVEGTLEDLMPESLPAELEIVLEVAPVLRGRVTAPGSVISGALVEALSGIRAGQSMMVNGFPSLMSPMTDNSATSAADGSFALKLQGNVDRLPGKRPLYLRCVAKGFAATVVGPIDLDAASTPIEIELTAGGAIEGRARAKDGTPVVGAIVGVTCGDGHPRTMLSGHDGVFRFEGLSVGPWLVMESDEEIGDGVSTTTGPKERKIDWSASVSADRTTYFDLTLER